MTHDQPGKITIKQPKFCAPNSVIGEYISRNLCWRQNVQSSNLTAQSQQHRLKSSISKEKAEFYLLSCSECLESSKRMQFESNTIATEI